jgi:hypothetical protein
MSILSTQCTAIFTLLTLFLQFMFLSLVTVLLAMGVLFFPVLPVVFAGGVEDAGVLTENSVLDPLNTTYWIEDRAVHLVDGYAEISIVQGSATKIRTRVLEKPVYGDINDDGKEDAVLILSHDPGGSGTFYYAAAALGKGDCYKGANTVLLGDRIVIHGIGIEQGVVLIRYADRRSKDPMSAEASVLRTAVLKWKDNWLEPVIFKGQGRMLYSGFVIIGHEVRSFQPCNQETVLWLLGKPDTMSTLRRAYDRTAPDAKPYQPVFMYLEGKWVGRPETGFGADYPAAFRVTLLIRAVSDGKCIKPDAMDGLSANQPLEVTFSLDGLDENGLAGDTGAKRAISYEFCIPFGKRFKEEVIGIDPTASCIAGSPGRVHCGPLEFLCMGSTHQPDFLHTLDSLADLLYVQRIDAMEFE